MKKITILSILVLLASWWVVGPANSESSVDDCNYEEVCKDWCEDPGDEEEDVNEDEDELCIPMDYIIFDLDIGILKIIGYIDLQLD